MPRCAVSLPTIFRIAGNFEKGSADDLEDKPIEEMTPHELSAAVKRVLRKYGELPGEPEVDDSDDDEEETDLFA